MTAWTLVMRCGEMVVDETNDLLFIHEEDVRTVQRVGDDMIHALYDMVQCEDAYKDGDVFMFKGKVVAACVGVHVVPGKDYALFN